MTKTIITIALTALFSLNINAQTKQISSSTIHWRAEKVTGFHEGNVVLKSGAIEFKKDQIVAGEFTMDMTTIDSTDLEGEWEGKLIGHLKSDDFFSVEKHPESTLVFTSVKSKDDSNYEVVADLTIKGITKPISFVLTVENNSATAKLTIDRTQYDIKYNSGKFFESLGDKMIYDNFTIDVKLDF